MDIFKSLLDNWRNAAERGEQFRYLTLGKDAAKLLQAGDPLKAEDLARELSNATQTLITVEVIDDPMMPAYNAVWSHESWGDRMKRHLALNQ